MTPDQIAHALSEQGWLVVPEFVGQTETAALATDLLAAWNAGQLRPAGIGHGGGREVREDIRGDRILWLDPAQAPPAQQAYFERMDALRLAINHATFLGLFDLESHFAVYPPGSFYRKHLDRFRDDGARTVSCILYLNQHWEPAHGGQLRLYLDAKGDSEYVDIAPKGGTLVIFLSDRFWHEVLPAQHERLSLTGWFRTRG